MTDAHIRARSYLRILSSRVILFVILFLITVLNAPMLFAKTITPAPTAKTHLQPSAPPTEAVPVPSNTKVADPLIVIADFEGRSQNRSLQDSPADLVYVQIASQIKYHALNLRIERLTQVIDESASASIAKETGATILVRGRHDQSGTYLIFDPINWSSGNKFTEIFVIPITISKEINISLVSDQATYIIFGAVTGNLFSRGRYSAALPLLEIIRKTETFRLLASIQKSAFYTTRSYAYGKLENYELALRDAEQAIKLQPTFDAYTNRAFAYSQLGRDKLAIADYTKAISLQPKNAFIYVNRALLYTVQDKLDLAIDDYTTALVIDPAYDNALFHRGLLYFDKGKYGQAIADYTQVIALKPNDQGAYYERGVTHDANGEYDSAIVDFSKAIALKPDDVVAHNDRGLAYYHNGQYEPAYADYTQAIALDPNYALAYYNRGLLLYDQKNFAQAIVEYTRSIERDPEYADAYYGRGLAYADQGSLDKAIADYGRTIRLEPNYADAYYARGMAYKDKKMRIRAIADLRRFLNLSNDLEYRRYTLDALKDLVAQL